MITESIRLERERRKTLAEAQRWQFLNSLVRSPIVQLVGTVALAEYLEHQKVLSSRWAGALEGGVITMVGLQALKEYGVIGALAVGGGLGAGSAVAGMKDWSAADWGKFAAATAINPYLGITQMLGAGL